jgi:hypothetical protein
MRRELRRLWIRLTRALGVSGTVAIALLIPAIGLAAWMPTFRRDAVDAAALLVVKTQLASPRAQTGTRSISDVELTREFVAGFPILEQNATDIESIFEAAKAHNVALLKGEYQLKLEPNASFVVYTATFPIRSDYGALKDFSADVLKALPHVAMDELRLTRDSAGSTSIDAVVRFTFFYRSH